MNQLNPTPINPQGFTNMDNIQGMYGAQVPNTFTRNVNGQTNQNTLAMADELTNPIPPPVGVDTSIVPPYDINK